jgi:hypothetical protein
MWRRKRRKRNQIKVDKGEEEGKDQELNGDEQCGLGRCVGKERSWRKRKTKRRKTRSTSNTKVKKH